MHSLVLNKKTLKNSVVLEHYGGCTLHYLKQTVKWEHDFKYQLVVHDLYKMSFMVES